MKRGIVKSVLTLTLAATLMIADSGVVSAASNVVNFTPRASAPESVKTATVDSISVDAYGNFLDVYYAGTAARFNVYVNGELYRQTDGYVDKEYYYDEETNTSYSYISYVGYTSDSFSIYNIVTGEKIAIKIVPCAYNPLTDSYDEVATAAKETEYSKPFGTVSDLNLNYDIDSSGTYFKGNVHAYLNWSYSGGYEDDFEVYRSTDKKTWKLVGKSGTYSHYYYDYTVAYGTKYYYKVRPVSAKAKGAYSAVAATTTYKLTGYCSLTVSTKGKPVVLLGGEKSDSEGTGYYVYRSTKKGSGYTLIATCYKSFYEDTAAVDGKTYYYKVQPFLYDTNAKKLYKGTMSDPVGFQSQLGDHAMELTATEKSATSVSLKWGKVSGVTEYEVYCKNYNLVGSDYELLTTTKGQSFTKSKLVSGDEYSFVVRAVKKKNGKVTYYASSSVYVRMGAHSPDARITKKSFEYKNGTLTITSTIAWDRLFDVKEIKIQKWDNTKGDYVDIKKLTGSDTKYTLKQTFSAKKTDATTIYVTAIGKDNKEYRDSIICEKTLAQVTGVAASTKNATTATIKWKAVAGADSYTVYRILEDGTSKWVGSTDKLTLEDKFVQPGIKYTYWISAYSSKLSCSSYHSSTYYFKNSYYELTDPNYNGYVANTNYKAFTLTFAAPASPAVKATAKKTNTVSWKKNSIATGYAVYRSEKQGGKYTKIGTTNAKTLSYKDAKATSGKTYYYYVVATFKNDAGVTAESKASAKVSVKTK